MTRARPYEVVSLKGSMIQDLPNKISHGDFTSYTQAASLARIARRTFPERIVLVVIPTK